MQDVSVTTNVSPVLTVFFYVFLTLSIAIVVWTFRASRQPREKKPRATPLTFRISNIPSQIYKGGCEESLTQKDFEAILNDVQRGLLKKGVTPLMCLSKLYTPLRRQRILHDRLLRQPQFMILQHQANLNQRSRAKLVAIQLN